MRDFSRDHDCLSINTATIRQGHGRDIALTDIIALCARKGIRAISPWRDQVQAAGMATVARSLADHGMTLSGYCRGGMFPAAHATGLTAAIDDNRRALDEAAALQAPCLVLVVGGLPGGLQGRVTDKDIALARTQVHDGIAAVLDHARQVGVPLAIEPLHPMYAADRSCVNTLEQALDLCDAIDPDRTGGLGVALDVYHVWWDPKLQAQIQRAGKDRLLAFHICDWLTPTTDMLEDRGMMGDGVIDIPRIRSWVEAQGYVGFAEVEIFSRHWWGRSPDDVIDTCIARYRSVV